MAAPRFHTAWTQSSHLRLGGSTSGCSAKTGQCKRWDHDPSDRDKLGDIGEKDLCITRGDVVPLERVSGGCRKGVKRGGSWQLRRSARESHPSGGGRK